jgi:NAD(P)-dependent dehydrogenase (short-subunit alcohol dehydrogenase family)
MRNAFSMADQEEFSELSGDRNPMHLDPVLARRLMAGRVVVHGIHVMLRLLEIWPRSTKSDHRWRFSCAFHNPVSVGDDVQYQIRETTVERISMVAVVEGVVCVELIARPRSLPGATQAGRVASPLSVRTERATTALDVPPQGSVGREFAMAIGVENYAARFPMATQLLGEPAVRALGLSSYFVGMVCPGMHSIYSSITFEVAQPDGDSQRFLVRKFDDRINLLDVELDGVLAGTLKAFQRPPPTVQPHIRDLDGVVRPGDFAGKRVLVIGGSRGLGETTAKLAALGGAHVTITYATGRSDADCVAAEIRSVAGRECEVVALDLTRPFAVPDALKGPAPDAVFYFATPKIFGKRSSILDRTALDRFIMFYVERMLELCEWLERSERTEPATVFIPSSVAITDRPKGMLAYSIAKAGAELLADEVNARFRKVRVVYVRLPRLATDQTASVINAPFESTTERMRDVLRKVLAAGG